MKISTHINGVDYLIDIEQAQSIAIALNFNGSQPNHFGAKLASSHAMQGGGFIGDTKQGGSCNVNILHLNPHCNGTHTESIHHVVDQSVNIGSITNNSLSSCLLISVTPINANTLDDESYFPSLAETDRVIDAKSLQQACSNLPLDEIESLVIRTLPNSNDKKSAIYGEHMQPAFFTTEAMSWIAQTSIKHLLVDFPSVDKMYDEGYLDNHHIFWNIPRASHQLDDNCRSDRTISEMVYVNDDIKDGLYCLSLQIPAFETDAAPSRPLLYPLIAIES